MEKWTKKQELEIENDKLKIANVILENSVNALKYIIWIGYNKLDHIYVDFQIK
ncbi:hypothetical protein [Spiroplasma endosymbiont of Agriotes lineatus]|uniref:hypothetical protein n=1 Tax=Spiroplasma endosymbiont of Agriotes lineatus TaxID=3077930 RepID=UPI0030CF6964